MDLLLSTKFIGLWILVIIQLSIPKIILKSVSEITESNNLTFQNLTNFGLTREAVCCNVKKKNCSKVQTPASKEGSLSSTIQLSVSNGNDTAQEKHRHNFLKLHMISKDPVAENISTRFQDKPSHGVVGIKTNFRKKRRYVSVAKKTAPKENPYAVFMLKCVIEGDCGERSSGTLITLQWVLTSDTIVQLTCEGVYVIKIYAGGNNQMEVLEGELPPGSQVRISTTFHYSADNHLGMVKADTKFTKTEFVRPISVARDEWPWTTSTPTEEGPFWYGKYGECQFTSFNKFSNYNGDLDRQTLVLEAGLGCHCQFDDGHVNRTEFICSVFDEYPPFCDILGGAGLICGGQLRGVLRKVVMVEPDQVHRGRCILNGTITENCQPLFDLNIYQGLLTHLFYDSYPRFQWIHSFIRPQTTKPRIGNRSTRTLKPSKRSRPTKRSRPSTTPTNEMNTTSTGVILHCKIQTIVVLSFVAFGINMM